MITVLAIGDIHIYVSDFDAALRFWSQGLQLKVVESETTEQSAFAQLDFPNNGPSLQLVAPAEPWEPGQRPQPGARPAIGFDIVTTDFDGMLLRLIEHGGQQEGDIESYNHLRMVTISDPDGNAFDLIEVPADAE